MLRRVRVARRLVLARAVGPVGQEDGAELAHDRPGDAEVDVAHAARVLFVRGEVRVAQVHAAREAHPPVRDEDLAMISQVDVQAGPIRSEAEKRLDAHAVPPEE